MKKRKYNTSANDPEIEGEDYVVCQICGGEYKNLTVHLKIHCTTADEYKEEFGVDYVVCKNLRAAISDRQRRHGTFEALSREQVNQKLMQLAAEMSPITCRKLAERGLRYLANYARRYYGSFPAALEYLGLETTGIRKWDEVDWEEELREWVEQYGALSKTKLWKTGHRQLHYCAIKHYGSTWEVAKALGLPFEGFRKWTPEAIADNLAMRVQEGRSIAPGILNKEDAGLCAGIIGLYGSIEACYTELGYDLNEVYVRRPWTRDRIVRELRAWSEEHGALRSGRLRKMAPNLYRELNKEFPSVKAAAEELQLPYEHGNGTQCRKLRPSHALREDKLRKDLADWVEKHGPVCCSVFRRTDPNLERRAKQFYGSLQEAAKALNLPYKRMKKALRRSPQTRNRA